MQSPMTPTINSVIALLFIKILMAGIVNSQNYDLLKASNFGPNGNLSVGDQFSMVFGIGCMICALVIFIMISVNLVTDVPWMFNFGKKVVGIENILRRQMNHRWFMLSIAQLQTFIWIYIIIFLATPNFSVPQLLLSVILNPANLLIAWRLKPLPMAGYINLSKVE